MPVAPPAPAAPAVLHAPAPLAAPAPAIAPGRRPGVVTATWEVTGVLYRGGVPFGERSESVLPLSAPQAMKILGSKAVLLDF